MPCETSACADPTSEDCLLVVAEYCATSDDPACALVLPVFQRNSKETTTLTMRMSNVTITTSLVIVSEFCHCEDFCKTEAKVDNMQADERLGQLSITFFGDTVGLYRVCVVDEGGRTEEAAMLRLVAGNEGTCFFNAEDSPCTNP